jgi:protein subunit release factor A
VSESEDNDLRVDTYRPAGLGVDGSVEVIITHIPTGLRGEGYDQQGRYKVAKSSAMSDLQRQLDWHYGPWL